MTAKRTDANQKEIVSAFRDLGLSVLIMSDLGKGAPDIAVGFKGNTYLFEIKDGRKPPSARKLTPDELKFMQEWKGHYQVIASLDDVQNFYDRVSKEPKPIARVNWVL